MNIEIAFNNVDPKRKILVTGGIPTENLPTKSHDVMSKKERRTLVRVNVEDMQSSSTASTRLITRCLKCCQKSQLNQ